MLLLDIRDLLMTQRSLKYPDVEMCRFEDKMTVHLYQKVLGMLLLMPDVKLNQDIESVRREFVDVYQVAVSMTYR